MVITIICLGLIILFLTGFQHKWWALRKKFKERNGSKTQRIQYKSDKEKR